MKMGLASFRHFLSGVGLNPAGGHDVLSCQSRIVRQNLFLGLTGREEFENEFDRQTRPSNHRLPRQDLGIELDATHPLHNQILPQRSDAPQKLDHQTVDFIRTFLLNPMTRSREQHFPPEVWNVRLKRIELRA